MHQLVETRATIGRESWRGNGPVLWGGVSLLLWACYANGAFLTPAKTVLAVAAPGLGLLWVGFSVAWNRRAAVADLHFVAAEWFLLAIAILGIASVSWSLEPWRSLTASGTLLGALVFLHLGRRLAGFAPDATSSVLFILGEAGVLVSAISVLAAVLGLTLFTQRLDGQLLPTGTLGYANALAGFLVLTMAATVSLYAWSKVDPGQEEGPGRLMRRHGRVVLVAMLAPQVVALVLTRTKAVFAVLAFMALVLLIARMAQPGSAARRFRAVSLGLVLLITAGFLGGSVLLWKNVAPQMAVSGFPVSTGAPQTGADSQRVVPMTSDAFRIKTWIAAARAARERPILGYGLDTFYEAYAPFKQGAHTAYAHSLPVQQAVELGAIGVLLLFGFLATAVVRPYRILAGSLANPQLPLAIGLLAFMLHNLVDLTWYFPALLMLFSLLCGMLPSLASPGAEPSSPKA
ncbi:MAG: O-antigen ligase family protein [Actinobacteria bacterium]|nr:O-antigen ligase family protein [Actinomycetota bacterium]